MWDTLKNMHDKFHESIEEMQKLRGFRILIIHVLEDGPKNGVEIMDSIQEHHEKFLQMHNNKHSNHPFKHHSHRPSPGSVYPLLKKMVDEDLISKVDDGRYELTKKGKDITYKLFGNLQPNSKPKEQGAFAVKNALIDIEGYVSYLEDIKNEKLILHEELIDDICSRMNIIRDSIHEDQ